MDNHVHDQLVAYLDDQIADAITRAAIEQHLAACSACRAEYESTRRVMSRASTAIKGAGDAISIPDMRWEDARTPLVVKSMHRLHRPFRGDVPTPNGRKETLMEPNHETAAPSRRTLIAAGTLTFALAVLALIFLLPVMLGPRPIGYGAAPAAATETPQPTPTLVPQPGEPTIVPPPDQVPSLPPPDDPTPIPSPTPDLALGLGGFTASAIDVSTLPEYEIPTQRGGGGGGGGGGCEEVDPSVTVGLYHIGWDSKELCLYDIPYIEDGGQFTVRLIAPSGLAYERTFTVDTSSGVPMVLSQGANVTSYASEIGFIASDQDRTPVSLWPIFPAAQQYGDWFVQAEQDGQTFASGSVTVDAPEPIYSITRSDDPLDPFLTPLFDPFHAGDKVIYAGQGWEAGRSMIIALYAPDPARTDEVTTTMIPYYAVEVTPDESGAFRAEFVVGLDTSAQWYDVLFDPQPGEFKPERLGMSVSE